MVKSLFTVLDIAQNLLKNVSDVIPHFFKDMHVVPASDKDVMLCNYYACLPASCPSQCHLPMVINKDTIYWAMCTPLEQCGTICTTFLNKFYVTVKNCTQILSVPSAILD